MNRLLCFGVGVRTACPAAVTGGSTVRAAWFTEGWSPDGAGAAVEAVNVKAVYKKLLRRAETELPPRWQDHYKHYIHQGFSSHSDEEDPERINLMAERALEDAQWIVEKYQAKEEEDAAAVLAGRSADNTAATDGPARSYGDEEGPSATRSNPWSDPSSDGSTAWSSASIAGGLDEFPQSEKTERVHNRRKGYGDLM